MKHQTSRLPALGLAVVAMLAILNAQPSTAFAQGTAFTYQGRLTAGGNPASGTYNLTFSLFNTNASGVPIAGPVTNNAVGVTNGLFAVLIDFGSGGFMGATNWLEIVVETNGSASFTTLAPRQQLTPVPYAIAAESAGGLSGTLSASQLTSIGNTNGGPGNFFVGPSGNATTSGFRNTGNGVSALNENTSGYDNTANGFAALGNNTSGFGNTANGTAALICNTNGNNNTAIGDSALFYNTSGSYNTASGAQALWANTSGSNNAAYGWGALYSNTRGSYNAANGAGALWANTTGSGNTANGCDALEFNTSGSYNTANGISALCLNTSGSYNAANGAQALYDNTSGFQNTASGTFALFENTSGSNNTASGFQALDSNMSGSGNTANGALAIRSNTVGSDNTANGADALYSSTNGSDNTADGGWALYNSTSGSNNIALGYLAGYNITTGSSNIDIGNTGMSGDNNIIRIGSSQTFTFLAGIVQAPTIQVSGDVNASSVNAASANIDSTFFAQNANIGKLGIGTSTPAFPLDVVGNATNTYSGNFGFLNNSGAGGPASGFNNRPFSIRCSSGILCTGGEVDVLSDQRVKQIAERSDTRNDLETVRRLQVTDYRHIDTVANGSDLKKGFIAQEVRQVVPEAVTTCPNFIPSIYALATKVNYDADQKTLTLTLSKAHGLSVGDKVRLYTASAMVERIVTRVSSEQQFVVSNWDQAPDRVFVYGKYTTDCLALNYDRVYTTGIGAIQELAKQADARDARITQLESTLAELKAQVSRLLGAQNLTKGN